MSKLGSIFTTGPRARRADLRSRGDRRAMTLPALAGVAGLVLLSTAAAQDGTVQVEGGAIIGAVGADNRFKAKSAAEVITSVGDDPFLVVGRHGSGRAAAFASDCSPHWGSPEFLAWAYYAKFWSQLTGWVAGR
jgi:Putative glutamine amidotransferase